VVPSDRTGGNGHKLKYRRKQFFTVRVTKHSHMLPGKAVESPSLEVFNSWLGSVLGSLLGSCLSRGVGPEDLQRSLPTSTLL